jgi:hypothetical protein
MLLVIAEMVKFEVYEYKTGNSVNIYVNRQGIRNEKFKAQTEEKLSKRNKCMKNKKQRRKFGE